MSSEERERRKNRKRLDLKITNVNEENTHIAFVFRILFQLSYLMDMPRAWARGCASERLRKNEKLHVYTILFKLKFEITHSQMRAITIGVMCVRVRVRA